MPKRKKESGKDAWVSVPNPSCKKDPKTGKTVCKSWKKKNLKLPKITKSKILWCKWFGPKDHRGSCLCEWDYGPVIYLDKKPGQCRRPRKQ